MKKNNTEKVIYSLSVADLQTVANEELGRDLTQNELLLIEDKIGDFIDWYEIIHSAINQCID